MKRQQQARRPARRTPQSVSVLKANLKRFEDILNSPYVRPADFATRDRLARKLREARKFRA